MIIHKSNRLMNKNTNNNKSKIDKVIKQLIEKFHENFFFSQDNNVY